MQHLFSTATTRTLHVIALLSMAAVIGAPVPAAADARCYSVKSRAQQRCMNYNDFERSERCIERAERQLDRCIADSQPAATRPVMDTLPEPQPATDQCPPSAGGAPVACALHVETIVQPHVDSDNS